MDEMAEMGAMAGEMQAAGDEMQAMLDDELPSIRGMFSETAINALVDAANAAGAAVDLSMDGIEDDRDVAMLASQLKQLASDERFVSMMNEAPEVEASITVSPGGEVDEETLMMERM
jgi:hypothetical protein